MNEQLIKFIELCLEDGVISDKEREVIFRKSKELGVPDDECEILLNSLVSKHSKKSNQPETTKKKGGFFSSMFNEIKKNIETDSIKSSLNQVKKDFQKGMDISKERSPFIQKPHDVQPSKTNSEELEEKERLQKEKDEKKRLQKEKDEKKRLQKEKEEKERLQKEEEEKESLQKEQEEMTNQTTYNSSKDVFLNYPLEELIPIFQIISNSTSWRYSGEYGGIRENEQDNWLDFLNEEGEVFQVTYNGENQPCTILHMDYESNEPETPSELIKLIQDFFKTGDITRINKEIDTYNLDLNSSKDSWILKFDSDGNGEVDLIEGDEFNQFLKKYQNQIIEINREYIQQFVKLSSLIKTKKKNIQTIFDNIKTKSNQNELEEHIGILKNEIHNYELVLFNSLNMIVSLVDDDMITFFEIHESFDKLNIFNSNWENEMSQKLTKIEDGLTNLMYSINQMGMDIIDGLSHLTYINEESNRNLENHLFEINSSIKVNNLLTGIQTYQMYKINQNTKSLRG